MDSSEFFKKKSILLSILKGILKGLLVWFFPGSLLWFIAPYVLDDYFSGYIFFSNRSILIVVLIFLVLFIYVIRSIKEDLKKEFDRKRNEYILQERELKRRENECDQRIRSIERACNEKIRKHEKECNEKMGIMKVAIACSERREKQARDLLHSSTPFRDCALMADVALAHIFQESCDWLKYKQRPAPAARDEVSRMKKILKSFSKSWKEMEFKYNYILNVFPGLREYVDNDEDLVAVGEHIKENGSISLPDYDDRRRNYLSKEEYDKLSETEKSQLALDRYIEGRNRSRWQVGRDYEMSCAMQLQKEGYNVILNGIKEGREDLGRDLIASKYLGGLFGTETLLIQCKRWRPERVIRENVIMQLFGSAFEYQLQLKDQNVDIIPVLMVTKASVISDTALSFAKRLKVRIERKEDIDFPRIKCNINHGRKIYHLPFDQLYDRTEICNRGECYVWKVKEAEKLGFTRAKRHLVEKS